MSEKKIVILGGSGAIGSNIATEVIKEGYKPIIIGRNEKTIIETSKLLDCDYKIVDITDREKLVSSLEKCGEDIHGLAYCVGSINIKSITQAKENDFIESYKINVIGAINSCKALIPNLKRNKGSILFFSTVAVKQGFPNHTIISTAKGAIEGLTLSLAAELAPNIRVNCIAPSITNSEMSKNILANETIKKAIESMHPIPKIGSGKDFGKLSAFLLSKNNDWITGQIFNIDGGRSSLRIRS